MPMLLAPWRDDPDPDGARTDVMIPPQPITVAWGHAERAAEMMVSIASSKILVALASPCSRRARA